MAEYNKITGKQIEQFLQPVSGEPGHKLLPKVLNSFYQLRDEVKRTMGLNLRIGQSFRTFGEQQKLYDEYLAGGPLAAIPGKSYHEFGMGIDFYITNDKGVEIDDIDIDNKIKDMAREYGFTEKTNERWHLGYASDYFLPEKYYTGEIKTTDTKPAEIKETKPSSEKDRIYYEMNQYNVPEKYKETIANAIIESCRKYGLDISLVCTLISAESSWRIDASSGKAGGLMQLTPDTARYLGVSDVNDIKQNIEGGCKYLKEQLDKFGSVDKALAAYNAGPGTVEYYGGVPPPSYSEGETYNYVNNILNKYKKHQDRFGTYKPEDVGKNILNKYKEAINYIGLPTKDKYVAKVIAIDKSFNTLRKLLSAKYSANPNQANKDTWNTFEQFAYMFNYKVTNLFTRALASYQKVLDSKINIADPKTELTSDIQQNMEVIFGLYDSLKTGNIKNILNEYSSYIESAKQGIANIKKYLS